jgi:nicotinamidase-related amidase
MTTANIIFLIDLQKGFARNDLTPQQGGCLYVLGGEKVGEPAADLIRHLSDATIILSKDFHPENHIAFMENHPGVMVHRKEKLLAEGHNKDMLDSAVLDVQNLPFDNILLKKCPEGQYRAVAFQDGDQWRAVDTDKDGYITAIHQEPAAPETLHGAFSQTLWRRHCQRNTGSTLFVDAVMNELPHGLYCRIINFYPDEILSDKDDRGNIFHVVQKGVNADLHSYGIVTEDDGVTKTPAPKLFESIAKTLQQSGVTEANIYVGGLASNFCVEFSHNDIYKYLVLKLEKNGIGANVHFLTDISAGIPLSTPDGSWPDLASTCDRMAAFGTKEATTKDVIRSTLGRRHLKIGNAATCAKLSPEGT